MDNREENSRSTEQDRDGKSGGRNSEYDGRTSIVRRIKGNGKKKNSHAAVLNTGIAPNEHLNQYVVKSSHKIMNVVERMYPVNIHGRTMLCSP